MAHLFTILIFKIINEILDQLHTKTRILTGHESF